MKKSRWFAAFAVMSVLSVTVVTSTVWSLRQEKPKGAGASMTVAADAFLGTLKDDQKATALLNYDDKSRVDWHFIPKPTRKGLQLREMSNDQKKAALVLLQSALSQAGYSKATKIMAMENLLKELEKTRTGTPLRDSLRYYFAIFNKPTKDGKWGLNIEGHHLSLNFVVEKDQVVSSTPAAFAANPATVQADVIPTIPKGTRILAKEETLAFDLLKSLTDEQKAVAIFSKEALKEVRAPGTPQPPTDAPVGLAASKLTEDQRKILQDLIAANVSAMADDVAQARISAIQSAGWDHVHFGWAGPEKPGIGHYYRLQGPTFLVEFVNTQPDSAGNPANHIHLVWRDMKGDFGIPIAK